MLGLGRPRLKTRPSLLDLINNRRELELQQQQPSPPPPPPELPPLPDSPAPTSSSSSTTTSSIPSVPPPSSTQSSTTMAPAKDQESHGSIFSVSGPVVVAENMIGCAMYELVGVPRAPPQYPRRNSSILTLRADSAMLDTICSSVKLFVSRETRLPFRSTRKPVRLRSVCGPRMPRSITRNVHTD